MHVPYVPDLEGHLTRYTDAAGAVTQYSYNARYDLEQITDPRGNVTSFTYDPQGRIQGVTRGDDTVSYRYYAPTVAFVDHPDGCPAQAGRPAFGQTRVSDARFNDTIYCYDTHDRVYATFDAYGKMRETTFTNNDNVERFTAPSGAEFQASYDKDRPTGGTAPASGPGQSPATTEDCYGDQVDKCPKAGAPPFSPVRSTDAQGNRVAFEYGTNDNLTKTSSGSAIDASVSIQRDTDGDQRTVDSVTDAKTAAGELVGVVDGVVGGGAVDGALGDVGDLVELVAALVDGRSGRVAGLGVSYAVELVILIGGLVAVSHGARHAQVAVLGALAVAVVKARQRAAEAVGVGGGQVPGGVVVVGDHDAVGVLDRLLAIVAVIGQVGAAAAG